MNNPAIDNRLAAIKKRLTCRQLAAIVNALYESRIPREGARGALQEQVFDQLRRALITGSDTAERLLLEMNTPLHETQEIDHSRWGWSTISYEIFQLEPEIKPYFTQELLNRCVSFPTEFLFGLSHSDTIAVLVCSKWREIGFDNCIKALQGSADSRQLYALKALHWCPSWEKILFAAFETLFSSKPAIRAAAYWLLRERATLEDVTIAAARRGVDCPGAAFFSDVTASLKYFLRSSELT